jgi:uncharacterized protein (TIGR02145 family)
MIMLLEKNKMRSLNILYDLKVVIVFMVCILPTTPFLLAQQVEVQGALKVTQMTANDTQDNLVIYNADGTLGTRSVASLPLPPPAIDTIRNLASDYVLAKQLCNCPTLTPFMIQQLLESGYTQEDLVGAGVEVQDVIDAQRNGILIDPRDNQAYKTVKIGDQIWMAENLNFGTQVDGVSSQTDNNIIEKYCYEDSVANCTTYGGLYQWDEMMQYVTTESAQGVCPTGWHLPSDDEWKMLEMELGMSLSQADATGFRGTDQGSQLAGDELLWLDAELDQNGVFGSSGFLSFPGGLRNTSGGFETQDALFLSWSSSELGGNAWYRVLDFGTPLVGRDVDGSKSFGFSVRCVQD